MKKDGGREGEVRDGEVGEMMEGRDVAKVKQREREVKREDRWKKTGKIQEVEGTGGRRRDAGSKNAKDKKDEPEQRDRERRAKEGMKRKWKQRRKLGAFSLPPFLSPRPSIRGRGTIESPPHRTTALGRR